MNIFLTWCENLHVDFSVSVLTQKNNAERAWAVSTRMYVSLLFQNLIGLG